MRDWLIKKLGGATPAEAQDARAKEQAMQARVMEITQAARIRSRRELMPGIRLGMWCVWDGRVGIATGVHERGFLSLDLVDDSGQTFMFTHQPRMAVRQAKISEIPEPRRNVAVLRQMGYED